MQNQYTTQTLITGTLIAIAIVAVAIIAINWNEIVNVVMTEGLISE